MAVIAVWKCDRDGSMFENKKEADEHDKMLELAASITAFIEKNVSSVGEKDSEAIGLLLARRRDDLVKACKGKPESLSSEEIEQTRSGDTGTDIQGEEKVTPIGVSQTQ